MIRLVLASLFCLVYSSASAQVLKKLGQQLLEKAVEDQPADSTKSRFAINEKGEAKSKFLEPARIAINEKGEGKETGKSGFAINEKGDAKSSLVAPGTIVSDSVATTPVKSEAPVINKDIKKEENTPPDKSPEK